MHLDKILCHRNSHGISATVNALYMSDALPYTRETRIVHLLGVKNYLNNYFVLYARLTLSCIRVELASPAGLGLRLI